jgi:hypothetical protein
VVKSGLRLPASGLRFFLFVAACGSSRPKAVEDGKAAPPPPVAKPAVADAAPVATGGAGDVSVRVEWHDVPVAMRQSPDRTSCGTAQLPAVAPTTTWGIPDAFVVLSGTRKAPDTTVRVIYDRCAMSPRAVVASSKLAVTGTATHPTDLWVRRAFALDDLGKSLGDGARPLSLPIAGHEADIALDAGYVYEVSDATKDTVFVAAAPTRWVQVTDAAGIAVMRELPAGKYEVTAWFPPRGGAPGRLAHGEVTVTAGALAELTLDLGK